MKKKVRELRAEIEKERSSTLYRGPTDRERLLMAQLSGALSKEEVMERQRSRISWLKEGDRNTEFFSGEGTS